MQEGIEDQTTVFAEMRWMVCRMLSPIEGDPWSELYVQYQSTMLNSLLNLLSQ